MIEQFLDNKTMAFVSAKNESVHSLSQFHKRIDLLTAVFLLTIGMDVWYVTSCVFDHYIEKKKRKEKNWFWDIFEKPRSGSAIHSERISRALKFNEQAVFERRICREEGAAKLRLRLPRVNSDQAIQWEGKQWCGCVVLRLSTLEIGKADTKWFN